MSSRFTRQVWQQVTQGAGRAREASHRADPDATEIPLAYAANPAHAAPRG